MKVWLVGTYGLKAALMVYFGRVAKEGKAGFPTGSYHFPVDAPTNTSAIFHRSNNSHLAVQPKHGKSG